MPQRGREIGFAVESFAEFRVSGRPLAQDLERVPARQARVFGEVDVGHPAGSQRTQDGVAREGRRRGQRAVRRVIGAGSADVHGVAPGSRPDQRDPGQQPGDPEVGQRCEASVQPAAGTRRWRGLGGRPRFGVPALGSSGRLVHRRVPPHSARVGLLHHFPGSPPDSHAAWLARRAFSTSPEAHRTGSPLAILPRHVVRSCCAAYERPVNRGCVSSWRQHIAESQCVPWKHAVTESILV